MDGLGIGEHGAFFGGSTNNLNLMFKRASKFMDVLCYTGTGSNQTVPHNLGVAPEMLFLKARVYGNWNWFYTGGSGVTFSIPLDGGSNNGIDVSYGTYNMLMSASTATGFQLGSSTYMNNSGDDYVAYLFASLSGVSKCGSYAGNGSTQNIDCGFSAAARFILIKTLHTTCPIQIWNSERGIVAGNDPSLSLISTAAELTTNDYIDPHSAGFTVNVGNDSNLTDINKSGKTYAFLAIA
jgi:hypothetical protein